MVFVILLLLLPPWWIQSFIKKSDEFDDILIFSKNTEEYKLHLNVILNKLRKNQLYANIKKSIFFLRRVGILKKCYQWKRTNTKFKEDRSNQKLGGTKTQKGVRSFFKLINYYKNFIKKFFKIYNFLISFLKKDNNTIK